MADQIGVSGKARKFGIPDCTVGWGTSYTQFSVTTYTQIQKDTDAAIAETKGNDGEKQGQNRTNKAIRLSFSAEPIGNAASNAQAIAAALPYKGDIVKITCADDAQVACDLSADTTVVESARARYVPDTNALVIDFEIVKHIGKVFIALA